MKRHYSDKAMAANGAKGCWVTLQSAKGKPGAVWVPATTYEGIEYHIRREVGAPGRLYRDGPDWVFEVEK